MEFASELFGLAGEDAAGRDGVHADVVGGPVGGEIAGEADEGGFDYGIGDGFYRLLILGEAFFAIEALVGGDDAEVGRDVDDDASVAFDHFRAEDAGAEEGAGKAYGDVGFPDVEGEVFEAGPLFRFAGRVGFDLGVIGGVVDENVDAAELGHDRVAGCEEGGLGGDVGGKAEAFGAVRCLQLIRAEAGVGGGEIEEDDVGAGGGEDGAVVVAEEAGASGDDRYAAGEIEEGVGAVGGVWGDLGVRHLVFKYRRLGGWWRVGGQVWAEGRACVCGDLRCFAGVVQ